MLTIEPPPDSSMPGRNARIVRYIDRTFTFIENSYDALVAVEDRARVNEPCAVEQHVDRAVHARGLGDRHGGRDVEHSRPAVDDAREIGQRVGVDVGRDHPRALARERLSRCAADPLPGGGDKGGLV